MQIVDLSVLDEWVIVVFRESVKIFNFERGFTKENIVAQYPIRKIEGPMTQGQVAAFTDPQEKHLIVAFQNHEKASKIDIVIIS